MASYSVEFTRSVRKDFRKIPQKDAERILATIHSLMEDPRPAWSKKLVGEELYRIRVGMYRVIYEVEDDVLVVLVVKVGHRKDVYRV